MIPVSIRVCISYDEIAYSKLGENLLWKKTNEHLLWNKINYAQFLLLEDIDRKGYIRSKGIYYGGYCNLDTKLMYIDIYTYATKKT